MRPSQNWKHVILTTLLFAGAKNTDRTTWASDSRYVDKGWVSAIDYQFKAISYQQYAFIKEQC
jgi:hypothetical protein